LGVSAISVSPGVAYGRRMNQAVEDLRAINAQFIENFVTNDVAAHDALLHPSFLYIRSDGSRVDRVTYLEGWATVFDPDVIVYWDVRDELITVVGDVALVRSTNKETVRQDGEEVTSMSTYTDTYVLEDGRWRCVQAQITPVAEANEPADDTIVSVWIRGVRQPRALTAPTA
jgi:ketosteroid isomerase-like protein